ncbi:MAG TPA: hypothetical protein VEL11_12790 [Candidatus Bathyarchaeia archaeon]|nr:hypothetical protein [Candidatus Bathyarchaeia archaeon]
MPTVEDQIRRIFLNEIPFDIANNMDVGVTQDDVFLVIDDSVFLVDEVRSTITWSLLGQHVILYVELEAENASRIDFNLILCPNHDIERNLIAKMRNISSLKINIIGRYRSGVLSTQQDDDRDIKLDPNHSIRHLASYTLSLIGLDNACNQTMQLDIIRKYCPTCSK